MFATEIRFSRINSTRGGASWFSGMGVATARRGTVESVNLWPLGRIGISEPWSSGYNWGVRSKGLVEIHRLENSASEPLL